METIVSIFEQYGWMGIIGIILISIIFILLKKYGKKLSLEFRTGLENVGEKLTDQISKQNDQLIDVIVKQQDKILTHIIDTKNRDITQHTNMMIDKIKLADEIIEALKTIMYTHQSQRAFIIEFHNSYQNLSGIPFAKYSCTYEWFEKGMVAMANLCMGLPFSQISPIVADVLKSENQQKVYSDMSTIEDYNPSLYQKIENENIKQIIYTAMFDQHNIPIGLLVLEYNKEHQLTSEELNQLKIQSAELTQVINIRYKYSSDEN